MNGNFNRRRFLQTTAGVAAGAAVGVTASAGPTSGVAIVVDPADAVASSAAARWAAGELERALAERGVSARIYETLRRLLRATCESWRPEWLRPAPRRRSKPQARARKRRPRARPGGARAVPGKRRRVGVRARRARPDVCAPGTGRPRAPRRRPAGGAGRAQAGDRAPGQHRPQRHAAVHQRRRRQALVQRPRDVAGVPLHAGRAALQPLQPGLRHRLRLPDATSPTPTSCSPIRSCSPCPDTTCACRSCRTPSAIATSRCCASSASRPWRAAWSSSWASGCTATSGSTARTRTTRSKASRRNPRALLPRRSAGSAPGRPEDQRRHLPHPRRERRRRRAATSSGRPSSTAWRPAAARSRSTCTPRAWTRA